MNGLDVAVCCTYFPQLLVLARNKLSEVSRTELGKIKKKHGHICVFFLLIPIETSCWFATVTVDITRDIYLNMSIHWLISIQAVMYSQLRLGDSAQWTGNQLGKHSNMARRSIFCNVTVSIAAGALRLPWFVVPECKHRYRPQGLHDATKATWKSILFVHRYDWLMLLLLQRKK